MTQINSIPDNEKFDDVLPVITQIRKAFGAPSISCGVLHENRVIFTHGEGLADVEKSLTPNADTLYLIASCSKAFTSATCGVLVDQNKLSWTEPIQTYVPDFQTTIDPEVGKRATLLDLCSHGLGLAPVDHLVCGFHDEFFIDGKDQIHTARNLPVCYDFRSQWLYNNTILGVVGDVIARVSGKSAGTVLREEIFEPLGMKRSCTKTADYPKDGNFARGYSVLDDHSLVPLEYPSVDDGATQASAAFVRTSVREMLIWAQAVMEAESEDFELKITAGGSNHNPLRQMQLMRSAHRPITLKGSGYENSYGLGWFRHMLPSSWLGSIGPNFALLKDPPVVNQAGPPRLAIAHYGEFNGFLTAFYTFPETKSAVIVMANCSPGRGDPADLIAQALFQKLFDMEPHVKLEDYALKASRTSSMLWPALVEEWVCSRVQNTQSDVLEAYVGSYSSKVYSLSIDVFELQKPEKGRGSTPELLGFTVNGLARQTAKLRHYHYDTWTFLPDSRDDALCKGLENFLRLPMLLLSFVRGEQGSITGLDWDLQAGLCEGPAPGIDKIVAPIRFNRDT